MPYDALRVGHQFARSPPAQTSTKFRNSSQKQGVSSIWSAVLTNRSMDPAWGWSANCKIKEFGSLEPVLPKSVGTLPQGVLDFFMAPLAGRNGAPISRLETSASFAS